ncbi:hypothetical protein IFM89_014360 [Coptis chinensis]|uniref:3-oxo-5-alpha-steroid 4-dehydrogenase C-terminal domain-containing protein n=1 Tax=Coptis chinensis TaxID=261450 RepID=A0A835MEF6_9MAGN|nr:hypothetical protein IFM89_014360 [Coptis chinensis]
MTWVYACKMVPLGNEPLHYSTIASHLTGGSHIFSMHKYHSTPLERRYTVWRTVLLLLLMEVQVWRRLFETVYVFSYSPSARMHIFGYFTGLFKIGDKEITSSRYFLVLRVAKILERASFYTAAPLSLCSSCASEVVNFAAHCVAEFIKGREKMPIFEFDWFGYVNPLTKLGWLQWIGAAICIWGWIHQHSCHAILGSLREHKEQTDEYVIPHGDWFEIVSCPHYLAEIVIYAGLLVASGGSDPTIWLLFGFVVINLVFTAAETQRWRWKYQNRGIMNMSVLHQKPNAILYGMSGCLQMHIKRIAIHSDSLMAVNLINRGVDAP